MLKLNLDEEHKVLFKILRKIQNLLAENDIPFFLIGGSAIGAVREGGIIPWDDDIDIGIERKHFSRVIELLKESDLNLYVPSKDINYILPFLKVVEKVNGQNLLDSETGINGAYIDIFPIDNTFENKVLRKMHQLIFRMGHAIVVAKAKPNLLGSRWGKIGRRIFIFIASKTSSNKIFKLRDTYIRISIHLKYTNLMCNFGTPYGLDKELYYKNEIESQVWKDFNSLKVPIAIGFDQILRRTYGDYMVPPKESLQLSKHLSEEPKE